MRKYSINLIELILSELKNGATVSELSKKYSIDRRRISEWKNNKPELKTIEVFNKNENKTEIEKTITSSSKDENTLEDILNKNGISPDEWEVSNASINQWTDSKGVLHNQSKVNVVKKKISLELEIPAPININISTPVFNLPCRTLKCAVILSDMQIGFRRDTDTGNLVAIHDRVAMNTALQITKLLNPNRVVLLGDNLDFAEFSTKYTIPSDFYFTTQASIVELAWWLGRLRSINAATKIDYLAGNHENRIEKYINNKAVALSNLRRADDLKGNPIVSVPSLLGLDGLNIHYHDYPQGKVALNSNLVCIHGETAKGMSGATVSEVVKSARVSTIQGHIHRHEVATKTVWDAFDNYYMYTAASFGCLCKIEPGFVPGMKYRQNWQNGMGIVWYEDDGLEQFQTEFVPIIKGRALYCGSVLNAVNEKDIVNIIERDTKYKLS